MNKKVLIIIGLLIVFGLLITLYLKEDSSTDYSNYFNNTSNTTTTEAETTKITATSKAQVQSALEEKLELHATYKFLKIYYKENTVIKKGSKILKYTNGKYLVAPYDLIITSKNIPSKKGKVTNEHYLNVISVNVLKVQIKVDEAKIGNISLGSDATIKIGALNNKKYEGIVTNISSTASNKKFTVTIEFDNDGEVLVGMTSEVSI